MDPVEPGEGAATPTRLGEGALIGGGACAGAGARHATEGWTLARARAWAVHEAGA